VLAIRQDASRTTGRDRSARPPRDRVAERTSNATLAPEGRHVAHQGIDIRKTTPAEPAAVWRLLGDSFTWPSWTPIEWVIVDRHGDKHGLGEMRTIKLGRSRLREEIIERQVESTLSYKLSSGRPLRHYHVDIDLTPLPEGTEIRWYTTVKAMVPGLGWLYRRALTKMTQEYVDGLARHSAREGDGPAPG
jgi:hypothetical protein